MTARIRALGWRSDRACPWRRCLRLPRCRFSSSPRASPPCLHSISRRSRRRSHLPGLVPQSPQSSAARSAPSRALSRRRAWWAVGASAALIAAPPAFWWIGLTRLPVGFGSLHGSVGGSAVAGLALAPVTYLLVLAAAREIPSNAYEAARVSLNPARRFAFVLFPLLRPAVLAGFLLTTVLLLGESEIPFLFGFRTSMTDVVTTFSQTFDPGEQCRSSFRSSSPCWSLDC